MKTRYLFLLVFLSFATVLFFGCANLNYSSPLEQTEKLKFDEGYLYGNFLLDRDAMNFFRLALQIENQKGGEIISLRLVDEQPVYAVHIEPGKYKIKNFVYAPLGAMAEFELERFPLPDKPKCLKEIFEVKKGEAVYLGDFHGTSKRTGFVMGGTPALFMAYTTFRGSFLGYSYNFSETTSHILKLYPPLKDLNIVPAFKDIRSVNQ